MAEISLIGQEAAKLLSDGKYDTRRRGAAEIDRKVAEYIAKNDTSSIHTLVMQLKKSFNHSIQTSYRKGGLLAITAVAIALSPDNISDVCFLFSNTLYSCISDLTCF